MAGNEQQWNHPPDNAAAGARLPEAPIVFAPGEVITGQFEVLHVIGKGGMGVVYEVFDRVTKQRLALKTIRPSRLERPGVIDRFLQEATLARRLRHPSMVAVYDVRREGRLLFYTMELLEGKTLRALMNEQGLFSLRAAVRLLQPLCLALEQAHTLLVHQDISPENIMVVGDGVKLLDFGIARLLNADAPPDKARGKAYYTAPEQGEEGAYVDGRADVYALGVIFGELLAGKRLKPPVESSEAFQTLSPSCQHVLSGAVAPLETRFPSMREFRTALEQCIESAPSPQPVAAAPSRSRPRTGAASWVAALAVVAMAGMAIYYLGGMIARERQAQSIETARNARTPAQFAPMLAWKEERGMAELTLPGGGSMRFVHIPAGVFVMGKDGIQQSDAAPAHIAAITRGFWLSATEVTQTQWEAVMSARPWAKGREVNIDSNAPAVYISWHNAQAYAAKLQSLAGGEFRLPTEAEWEYACRASSREPSEAALDTYAWHASAAKPPLSCAQPCGTKEANDWGVYDMQGNVAEWCADWYAPTYYAIGPRENPQGPASGMERVMRGGSWASPAAFCSASARGHANPNAASSMLGFRICRNESETPGISGQSQ